MVNEHRGCAPVLRSPGARMDGTPEGRLSDRRYDNRVVSGLEC